MITEQISQKEIEVFFKELSEFCTAQEISSFFTFEEVNINRLAFSETFRSIVSYEFSNSVLSDLLISKMEGLDRYSPASACFLPFFINNIKNHHGNFLNNKIEDIEVFNPTVENIEKILDFCFSNASFIDEKVAKNIFKNNGFISEFQIKPSLTSQNAIIFSSGTNIKCNNFSGFFESVSSREFIESNVILYDGFIENVSELNYVLTKSNEEKSNFIIICSGASMDVLNTCAVNLESRKANVFLAIPDINFWNSDFLELKKNIPLYGLETGRLLNNIEEENICHCVMTPMGLYLKDVNSNGITKANTEIYLRKESWGSRGILSDQLNHLKSLLQQIATCGVVKRKDLSKYIFDIDKSIIGNLELLPAFPVIRAIKEAEKFCSQIFNIGCILRIEN